jgi:DNA repair protein RadC
MEITSSGKAFHLLKPFLDNDVEEFWVVALSSTKQVIRVEMVARGTVDSCCVHPRDVFRFALRCNASSLLVGHNHPSGDCRPSTEDLELTHRLLNAGELLQIPLVDHVILSHETYLSLADQGYFLR